MLGLKHGTVMLYTHEKEWETEAHNTILRLKQILGNTVNDIQHVGSTAIPSIKAKPIIDIAASTDDFGKVLSAAEALEKEGFYYRPHKISDSQLLFACGSHYSGTGDMQTHFIHIVKTGSMEWINYINFRDYLNKTPSAAKEYEKLKLSLAEANPTDSGREKYLQGKHDFIVYTLRKALVSSYLGKTVQIKIDRPIGYIHKKKYYSLHYPINYGFIPGVFGGDGEELDVYLTGVDIPVKEYTGRIIGIAHRKDDVEDKLIMAPENIYFSQNEIAEKIDFQERYYHTCVESIFQKSCGAVIYRRHDSQIEYLCLLQKQSQTYSVPKGHMEAFESEEQTAEREILEEIGIHADFEPDFKTVVQYSISEIIRKRVIIFLAECRDSLKINGSEISEYVWLPLTEAKKILPVWYSPVLDKAEETLCKNSV